VVSVPEPDVHADLGGYALGQLTPGERLRFETHLETCLACRRELPELEAAASLLGSVAPPTPIGLEGKVFRAVERAATAETEQAAAAAARVPAAPARPRRRRQWRPRPALAGGAAALAAATAVLIVTLLFSGGRAGELELELVLAAPSGVEAEASVRKIGIGRVIEFRTDKLPILPKSEYYELWFVGPGDSRTSPNRISAGTFHPDANGRSDVTFVAAVDPALYPVLSVTAEPGDGDPRPNGPEVLRSNR